ncbi:MAG TPA: prenyltransferase/squalene oxidase repeat-containing protein [Anaerolineae bacterium]|nr:prenyltransferase/squalene oxidase repeat-containing protein [Anaerolineae bacterium]
MSRAIEFLHAAQNADGGWGYKPSGMSFVEPTAAVLLALHQDAPTDATVQRAQTWLAELQRADGGWGIAALDEESGWMTAWAVWALTSSNPQAAQRGVNWLLQNAGIRVTDPQQAEGVKKVLRIDPTITGWSWQPGDAAWIFPTALTLLALNAMNVRDHPRVTEALAYLQDRAIATGGWNIGNPFMVTGDMPPTVENTVMALMALNAFDIKSEITQRANEWLFRPFTSTAFEWSWRAWYWAPSNVNVLGAREVVSKMQREDGSWDGNPFTTAIALLAKGEKND